MEFPHLNDTPFPNLDTVDVYEYQNDFDYTRWVPNTKLKLVNVRWNGDYNDVVKFENDEARDAYFDELASDPDCTVILNTNVRMDKSQIKVPIPFDKAVQYNYLVVDIPIATSSDNKLNYESADGFRRWHFFIQDWQNTAPSTTVLTLALDIWTQFINSVGINYMMLERGHAPVAATNTEKYLANPIENSEYLLAPDVNYGADTITRDSKYIPFGNGAKYVCFASSCTPSKLSSLGTVTTGGDGFTNPTFSNETDYPDSTNRWGYQYKVENYSWNQPNSYAGLATPAANGVTTDGRIPNNTTVYAVAAADADDFLADLLKTQPTFLKTVLGCFMVDSSLVTVASSKSIGGHTVYVLKGNEKQLDTVTLSKTMFNYPEKYQRFAKLYTYPYAELEVTDNNGKSVNVRIESTGSIKAQSVTSVAFPYLNMRVFLTGINGVGSESYKWTDLSGSHNLEISNSDWYKCCFDMDIPMYALYMDGETAWKIGNYNRAITNGRSSALVNYHNSVRQANNAYENSIAESDTANTNATKSATTAANNAIRSTNTMKTNTDNSADTLVTCTGYSVNCNTKITNQNNSTLNANAEVGIKLEGQKVSTSNIKDTSLTDRANTVITSTTKEENEVTVATTQNQVTQNTVSSTLSGAVTGGIAGATIGTAVPGVGTAIGAGVGAAAGAAGALFAGHYSNQNASIVTQAATTVANLTKYQNTNNTDEINQYNSNILLYNNAATRSTVDNTQACNTANRKSQNTCATNTAKAQSSNMKTNASNLKSTNTTNATSTKNTAINNADRTKTTSQTNSKYTRNAAVAAAKDILQNTQAGTKALFNDSKNMDTVQLTPTKGDMAPDYMRNRGIQVKVRTQSASAVRMVGDEFVRHGYALNQIWDVEESGYCLMKHFTYWKSSDCWVYSKCETNDSAETSIAALFNRGVTVWSDPDEVGRVNPYGN